MVVMEAVIRDPDMDHSNWTLESKDQSKKGGKGHRKRTWSGVTFSTLFRGLGTSVDENNRDKGDDDEIDGVFRELLDDEMEQFRPTRNHDDDDDERAWNLAREIPPQSGVPSNFRYDLSRTQDLQPVPKSVWKKRLASNGNENYEGATEDSASNRSLTLDSVIGKSIHLGGEDRDESSTINEDDELLLEREMNLESLESFRYSQQRTTDRHFQSGCCNLFEGDAGNRALEEESRSFMDYDRYAHKMDHMCTKFDTYVNKIVEPEETRSPDENVRRMDVGNYKGRETSKTVGAKTATTVNTLSRTAKDDEDCNCTRNVSSITQNRNYDTYATGRTMGQPSPFVLATARQMALADMSVGNESSQYVEFQTTSDLESRQSSQSGSQQSTRKSCTNLLKIIDEICANEQVESHPSQEIRKNIPTHSYVQGTLEVDDAKNHRMPQPAVHVFADEEDDDDIAFNRTMKVAKNRTEIDAVEENIYIFQDEEELVFAKSEELCADDTFDVSSKCDAGSRMAPFMLAAPLASATKDHTTVFGHIGNTNLDKDRQQHDSAGPLTKVDQREKNRMRPKKERLALLLRKLKRSLSLKRLLRGRQESPELTEVEDPGQADQVSSDDERSSVQS